MDNFKARAGIRRGVMTKGTQDEEYGSSASPEFRRVSTDVAPSHNAPHVPGTGPDMDNGIESEDSPDASPLRLPSWSHHDLSVTANQPSILRESKQGLGIPTLHDAEIAMDTVLAFIYGQDDDFVTSAERDVLQHVRTLLFQTSRGLVYHREY